MVVSFESGRDDRCGRRSSAKLGSPAYGPLTGRLKVRRKTGSVAFERREGSGSATTTTRTMAAAAAGRIE